MSGWKKLASAAAGSAEGLSVEELFSAYVYQGNSSTQTITNGLDLSGEGGMVWAKLRESAASHHIYDTERGATKRLLPDSDAAQATDANGITSFNSNGFTAGSSVFVNNSSYTYASWSFRKAPKFFDVVTYTGNGTAGRTVSHNLGSTPGCIMVKRTNGSSSSWIVYHRGLNYGTNPATKALNLERSVGEGGNTGYWNNTEPTDSVFTVGSNQATNGNNYTYVAYLFAHNDGDGEFGPTGDQDIIKCGYYTGAGSSSPVLNIGFEPQLVIVKAASTTSDWFMFDHIRGFSSTNDGVLYANETNGEEQRNYIEPTATGFRVRSTVVSSSGSNYIYIAIRRGPMKTPENATDVFDVQRGASPFTSDFPVDLGIQKNVTSTGNWYWINRIRGDNKQIQSNRTDQEGAISSQGFDNMDEWGAGNWGSQSAGYSFRRAPGFFDMTIIPGNGSTTNTTHYHNLGVVPELIIGKQVSTGNSWWVYHKDVYPNDHTLNSDGYGGVANVWNDSSSYVPTETTFTTRGQGFNEAASNRYLIYLWATLAGISKVGTYTGNGSSSGDAQNIDCGFSNGARFVMIKRINHIYSDWYVADTGRGINAGNDSYMYMNRDNAEYTSVDWIDPYSSGFTVVYTNIYGQNISGDTYMYLAIA